MYNKRVVRTIIGKIDTSSDFKVEIKQGGSIAPVLFMFLVMAFAETLEDKLTYPVLSKS